MSWKCKALVFVFIAGFLLTVSLPASVFPRQEEANRQSEHVEKAAMVNSQEEQESEAAEEAITAEQALDQKTQPAADEEIEIIVPAPKDIKEATAIYVFLGWMWLSILVLIYFLRLKVKETDRIHELKFFSKDS
ncbi:MAG: hypothetical protein JXB23_09940 [Candidatus Aminicenantes bacterium]|nr:hypothetical protein [Candidatus Aminicenantes bacterium]